MRGSIQPYWKALRTLSLTKLNNPNHVLPPHDDEDMIMQMDEDIFKDEGEDQLIDDGILPALRLGSAPSSTTPLPPTNQNGGRRVGPLGTTRAVVDKSARKREQREREKEQQKMLLAKLIEIFEAGGGTCAVLRGQKKFPWVDLPDALIRIGCYFAGWPEKCLPKMSDKHPDRIDASTGPSQWSLKQKRAMEAQIMKGAVKVLPRPDNRAVIFEVVDDYGNVKDSTIEFSEEWVRNKLLGHTVVANLPPAPHAVPTPSYAPESRHTSFAMTADTDHSPQNHTLALPPIRSHVDYNERLDLPSLSKDLSGFHIPEDGSRSPSPMSNFSDERYHPSSLHPNHRHSYSAWTGYSSSSQDDLFPTRGRVEHGLPPLRSTSRPRTNHALHHHPYSRAMASSSGSSIHSRSPSPPAVNIHSHSHSRSRSGRPTPLITSEFPLRRGAQGKRPISNGSSPSLTSAGGQQRFPSHVPNVPSSIVAWDAHSRGWILKVQHDSGFRSLPCQSGGLVCWHRELDEWECRSARHEVGKAIWNRHLGRWELRIPSDEDMEASVASSRHAVFPTHVPSFEGTCSYDSEDLRAWVFTPSPEVESQLPISPATLVWSIGRKQWSLLPQSPQDADISWSHEDQSWHFNMQTISSGAYLNGSRNTSPEKKAPPSPTAAGVISLPVGSTPNSSLQHLQSSREGRPVVAMPNPRSRRPSKANGPPSRPGSYSARSAIPGSGDDSDYSQLNSRRSTASSVGGAFANPSAHSPPQISPAHSQPNSLQCHNCATMATPVWRKDDDGNTLCNACGLYLKLHGTRRPVSMMSDVIRKRSRHETEKRTSVSSIITVMTPTNGLQNSRRNSPTPPPSAGSSSSGMSPSYNFAYAPPSLPYSMSPTGVPHDFRLDSLPADSTPSGDKGWRSSPQHKQRSLETQLLQKDPNTSSFIQVSKVSESTVAPLEHQTNSTNTDTNASNQVMYGAHSRPVTSRPTYTSGVISVKEPEPVATKPQQASHSGGPPYEYDPGGQYPDPDAAWAHYYAKGGTDPDGVIYFYSVPRIKEPASNLTLQNEAMPSPLPIESSESTSMVTLEELMDQSVLKDLTGEVTVPELREAAHGGFATVYKGDWNGRTVAVKVLRATKNGTKHETWASMERRLSREIRVWAALSHLNIAEFLGFANGFADFPAMISKWYHLGAAKSYLFENERINKQARIRLVQDVARGLEYLHRLRIIHGDLKPTNVLIDDNHVARLCDFGLVRLDDWQGQAGMTTTSPYTGTERYKAPELFASIDNNHPLATFEGDIYALGCITLEFVESRLPYERYNKSFQLAEAVKEGEPPASRPKGQSDTVSNQHLWCILDACWEQDPEDRPKADQVFKELLVWEGVAASDEGDYVLVDVAPDL